MPGENPSESEVVVDVLVVLMDVRDTLGRMEMKVDAVIRQYSSLETRVEAVERRSH